MTFEPGLDLLDLTVALAQAQDEFDIESISEQINEDSCLSDYLHGRCHVMAIALGLVAGDIKTEGHRWVGDVYATTDFDDEHGHSLVHAYSLYNHENGTIVDMYGLRSRRMMMDDYMCMEPEHLKLSVDELLMLGEGTTEVTTDLHTEVTTLLPWAEFVWKLVHAQYAFEHPLTSTLGP